MRAHLTSFPALVIEITIALVVSYWLWNIQVMVIGVTAAVVALLYRIMILLEAIVSRG